MEKNSVAGCVCPPEFPVPQNSNVAESPLQVLSAVPLPYAKKEKEPFHVSRVDRWVAFGCLFLGFGFMRWLTPMAGFGVTFFTLLFAGGIVWYGRAKKIKPGKESWFWFSILLGTALSFSLWEPRSLWLWQVLLLFFAAVYWCGCFFENLLCHKTENWLLLDMANLILKIPFKNFGLLGKCLAFITGKKEVENTKNKTEENTKKIASSHWRIWGGIGFGLLLSIPFLAVAFPLLFALDSGGFSAIFRTIYQTINGFFGEKAKVMIWQFLLGLPVAFYLCGMVMGGAHKRGTNTLDVKKAQRNLCGMQFVPESAAATLLAVGAGIYLAFIVSQIPYYFSAFRGQLPPGYEVYAMYAREGFAELCKISALNLGMLACVSLVGKKKVNNSRVLHILWIILLFITLFFVTVGISKMMLYIDAYGLTPARIKTLVFMTYLALICGAALVLRFRKFSIVRFGLLAGSSLLCLLCLVNIEGISVQYNAYRLENGSLQTFDTELINTGDVMALEAGQRVYSLVDRETQKEIALKFKYSRQRVEEYKGSFQSNFSYLLLQTKGKLKIEKSGA